MVMNGKRRNTWASGTSQDGKGGMMKGTRGDPTNRHASNLPAAWVSVISMVIMMIVLGLMMARATVSKPTPTHTCYLWNDMEDTMNIKGGMMEEIIGTIGSEAEKIEAIGISRIEWGTMGVENDVTEETAIREYDREVGPNKQMQMMMYVVDDCLAGSGMKKTYTAGDWIQDPFSEFMRAIGIGLEIKTALSSPAVGDQREVSTETEEQPGNGIIGKSNSN